MTRARVFTAIEPATRARVDEAWAAYHATIEQAGPSDAWDRSLIDTVITALAMQGKPFSANAMRPLLPPEIRKPLIGARLNSAQRQGLIRRVGYTPSDLRSTKGAEVKVYAAARPMTTNLTKELSA